MYQLKPGDRLRSAVCDTEVIVVRAPTEPVALECGGAAMVLAPEDPPSGLSLDPARSDGTLIGKRYESETVGLEVLCTKPGDGSLAVDGELVPEKDAKPLPSSD